ncbi:MAG: DUF6152 family protein [Acidimicrobiia bacterium]
MRHGIVWVLVGLTVSSVVHLTAHHPMGRVYDQQRTMTIEGDVGRVLHVVPHPRLHLVVEDDQGTMRTWAVELDAANQLTGSAVSQAVLGLGDRIMVCGNPGRDPGEYRLHMLTLTRLSDGWSVASEHRPASQCESS